MAVNKRTAAGAGLVALGGLIYLGVRRPRDRDLPGRVELVHAPQSTVIGSNGAVRSVQKARLALPEKDLDRLWTAANLENLGATYWHFLTYVTLGIVRVLYREQDRRVTLFGIPWLTLLRFDPPDFTVHSDHAKISWLILDGLLVAPRGRNSDGGLALDVTRERDNVREHAEDSRVEVTIEVEVTNFYPALSSWLGNVFYQGTQALLHVTVTNAFLRSLGSLELHQSKIGRFMLGDISSPNQQA